MNKKEYLESRILDLQKDLNNPFISKGRRKNEAFALIEYKLDLQRELGINGDGKSSVSTTL